MEEKYNIVVAQNEYIDEENYLQWFVGDIISAGFCEFSELEIWQIQIREVGLEIPKEIQSLYFWNFTENCLQLKE
jgi:hypothetical protein